MFSLLNGIYDSYFSPVQLNVLVVGGHGSGKTAFLERLRVTDIPTRSTGSGSSGRSGGRKSIAGRMSAEEMTKNLERALAETGAEHIRRKLDDEEDKKQRPRSSSFLSAANAAATADSANTSLDTGKTTSGTAASTQNKKRFNFCPAPQRYSKAATQDDQDEVVEEGEAAAQPEHQAGGGGGWEQEIRGELNNGATSAISAPPQRVRCHSKELDMDSLDLMDGRRSSMQDIPLDQPVSGASQPAQQIRRRKSNDGDEDDKETMQQEVPQHISQLSSSHHHHHHHPRNMNDDNDISSDPPLRQMASEEYDMKPKVTMLPLRLIRPTSKFLISCLPGFDPTPSQKPTSRVTALVCFVFNQFAHVSIIIYLSLSLSLSLSLCVCVCVHICLSSLPVMPCTIIIDRRPWYGLTPSSFSC